MKYVSLIQPPCVERIMLRLVLKTKEKKFSKTSYAMCMLL